LICAAKEKEPTNRDGDERGKIEVGAHALLDLDLLAHRK